MNGVGYKRLVVGLILIVSWSGSKSAPHEIRTNVPTQYLNIHQPKLGTIIIQTVHIHILQHDSVVTGSLPEGEFFALATQPTSS
jgi:hypothetical protein